MTDDLPIVAVIGPSLSSEMLVVGQISPIYDVLHVCMITRNLRDQLCVQPSFRNWNIILKSMVLKGFLLINCRGEYFYIYGVFEF